MYDILSSFRARNKKLKGIKLQEIKFILSNKKSISPSGYRYKPSTQYVFIINENTKKITRLDCVKKYYEDMKYNNLNNCSMIQTSLKINHCNSCDQCHLSCIDNFKNGIIK